MVALTEGASRGLQPDPILEPFSAVLLMVSVASLPSGIVNLVSPVGLPSCASLAIAILLGVATFSAHLAVLRSYIRRRQTAMESVNEAVEHALSRVSMVHRFEVAVIDVERVTISEFLAPATRVLVISKPAAIRILRDSDKAEPILADSLVSLDQSSLFARYAGSTALFLMMWWLYGVLSRPFSGDWILLVATFGVGTLVFAVAARRMANRKLNRTKRIEEIYTVGLKDLTAEVFGGVGPEPAEHMEAAVRGAWSSGWLRYVIPLVSVIFGTSAIVLLLPFISLILSYSVYESDTLFVIVAVIGSSYGLPLLLLSLLKHEFEPKYLVGGLSDPTCAQVETMMQSLRKKNDSDVWAVRKDPHEGDMYILRDNRRHRRAEIEYVIPKDELNCLHEGELIGSYAVSQVLLERAYRSSVRSAFGLVLLMLLSCLAVLPFTMYLSLVFHLGTTSFLIPFLYAPMVSVALVLISRRKTKVDKTTDIELSRQYPRHPESLRRLVDCGVVPMTGRLSSTKRIMYLRDAGLAVDRSADASRSQSFSENE